MPDKLPFPDMPAEIRAWVPDIVWNWWLAFRSYILSGSAVGTLPYGGTSNQILNKTSSDLQAATWGNQLSPGNTVVPETTYGQAPDAGTDASYSREDHTHGTPPAPTIISPSDTVTDETAYGITPDAGTGDKYSREDHTHGSPTAPVIPVAGDTVTDETTYGITTDAGASDDYSRKDHTHGSPPPKIRYIPASLTLNTGTNTGGNVASVTVPLDGDTYDITEVSGSPGFDLDLIFADVVDFNKLNIKITYDGASNHRIQVKLYNYLNSAWDDITVYTDTGGYSFWITVDGIPCTNYIDAGASKVKLYHVSNGNTGHHTKVDYVSLVKDSDEVVGGV